MSNISSVVTNVRKIIRNEENGLSGDAQILEQLGWMLFLKILDAEDQRLERAHQHYVSVIPNKFRWQSWAAEPRGITGDELIQFIKHPTEGLFASLAALQNTKDPERATIVREVFERVHNYMESGSAMRRVINQLEKLEFANPKNSQILASIYEQILNELNVAGTKGEFYTPRAITALMTQLISPKLGEVVLDPAAGTGGFLTASIDWVRNHELQTEDAARLQTSFRGWESKPVPYVLGLSNMILHGVNIPEWKCFDSLTTQYNELNLHEQVDVVLANPPFGAGIAEGVEKNFPPDYRCKESAVLFLFLILRLIKPGGRCAIVLPDSCLSGEMSSKIKCRQKLLSDCNLHTIIRLPDSAFFPAKVSTNLLFFHKGSPTQEIWYYEHRLPAGQKSYSKKKPIDFKEFAPLMDWWFERTESDVAWKVNVESLGDNYNLDIKNPRRAPVQDEKTTEELVQALKNSQRELGEALLGIEDLLSR